MTRLLSMILDLINMEVIVQPMLCSDLHQDSWWINSHIIKKNQVVIVPRLVATASSRLGKRVWGAERGVHVLMILIFCTRSCNITNNEKKPTYICPAFTDLTCQANPWLWLESCATTSKFPYPVIESWAACQRDESGLANLMSSQLRLLLVKDFWLDLPVSIMA